jgi:hypothetical protein
MDVVPESCIFEDAPRIKAEVVNEWLAMLPRQQRRNLLREAEKKPNGWLYSKLAQMKLSKLL